ncbi:MAG: hypothetical protein JWN84_3832 [Nocardioides sp.]|nr:hypothetical protein [Nocardioides sp.]
MNDDQIENAYERLTTALAAPPDASRLVAGRVAQRRRRRRGVQGLAAAACVAALAGGVGLASGDEPVSPTTPTYAADTTAATSDTTVSPTPVPGGIDCSAPPPATDEPVNLELLRVLTQTLDDGLVSLDVETRGDQVAVAVYDAGGEIRYVLHVVDDGASYRVLRQIACDAPR